MDASATPTPEPVTNSSSTNNPEKKILDDIAQIKELPDLRQRKQAIHKFLSDIGHLLHTLTPETQGKIEQAWDSILRPWVRDELFRDNPPVSTKWLTNAEKSRNTPSHPGSLVNQPPHNTSQKRIFKKSELHQFLDKHNLGSLAGEFPQEWVAANLPYVREENLAERGIKGPRARRLLDVIKKMPTAQNMLSQENDMGKQKQRHHNSSLLTLPEIVTSLENPHTPRRRPHAQHSPSSNRLEFTINQKRITLTRANDLGMLEDLNKSPNSEILHL